MSLENVTDAFLQETKYNFSTIYNSIITLELFQYDLCITDLKVFLLDLRYGILFFQT